MNFIDTRQVEEAADRVWYKRTDPWMPKGKKTSRYQHATITCINFVSMFLLHIIMPFM